MNKTVTYTIQKEIRAISRYAGLFYSRMLLLGLLFFLLVALRPNSIYLFAFTSLLPWILGNMIEDTPSLVIKKANASSQKVKLSLHTCVKKYHFSFAKFHAEQISGYLITIIFIIWQFSLTNSKMHSGILQFAPVFCLFLYWIARICSTLFIKKWIHTFYSELKSLE